MKCQKHGSLLIDRPFDDCYICLREENEKLRVIIRMTLLDKHLAPLTRKAIERDLEGLGPLPPVNDFVCLLVDNQPPDYLIVNLETPLERQRQIIRWLRETHHRNSYLLDGSWIRESAKVLADRLESEVTMEPRKES